MTDEHAGASDSVHKPGPPAPGDVLVAEIVDRVDGAGWYVSFGEAVVVVPPESLAELGIWLRDERGFDMCVDVTAVDYLDQWDRPMGTWQGEPTRYEVVVNLLDLGTPRRLRIRVPVEEAETPDGSTAPTCPTLAYVWASADAAEREVYDMFGIVFEGHPNLTRILMPDDWEGFPLRKDFAVERIPVTFHEGSASGQRAGRPPGPGEG